MHKTHVLRAYARTFDHRIYARALVLHLIFTPSQYSCITKVLAIRICLCVKQHEVANNCQVYYLFVCTICGRTRLSGSGRSALRTENIVRDIGNGLRKCDYMPSKSIA